MAERDYTNDPEDYWRNYPDGNHPGGVTPPSGGQPLTGTAPNTNTDPYADYNNGSPPDAPLQPGHGWFWNGTRWVQTAGSGLGYVPVAENKPPDDRRGPIGGSPNPPPAQDGGGGSIPGVPASYQRAAFTGTQLPTGAVPTLASAIAGAKQLAPAPTINPYAEFQAPEQVGKAARDAIVNAILNRPQTMDQTAQDQLFEQQKEQQRAMGQEASQRLAQSTAGRGLSAAGGTNVAGNLKLEQGFIQNLLSGRRDITLKANEINRQNELAAVELANAVNAGDFARAQAAYQTQLAAKQAYDELRFKAAEFDRGNVALAAQTEMAGRQQQTAESMASFQQYMDQLKFDEMMRQFNEQLGFNYGQFNWNQQMDVANMFPS